ncbi:hypothetical protein GYH30_047936 [Glycine max]|nr:hypothetical protein GYH30_047936 [Glycine max]
MAREWRPAFCMLICSLDGQWNHDPWFKEDHFVDSVRFSIVPVEGDSHILPFYLDLLLVLSQYPMFSYMCVSSTPPSPSLSSAATDIVMMVEEYVSPSPNSEIPLSTYLLYDPVAQTSFLMLVHPIGWIPVLDDYADDDNDEEEDPSEDSS